MAISALRPGESPRTEGHSREHIARLAGIDAPLPPILVNRRNMQVIDGTHRLLAALLRGDETIRVTFFDGTAEEAFLCSVQANVEHGLPLSLADRQAAATRIVASHPHMSDRAIARASGLGAKAVAAIRRRSTDAGQRLNTRMGRDGKVRPLNGAEGRRRAAEVMAQNPNASLREVARLAGISPATASDVRKRLQSGEPPAPVESGASDGGGDAAAADRSSRPRRERLARLIEPDPGYVLEKLLRDPSLRHREEGRQLLRLLQHNAIARHEWSELTAAVPPHCGTLVVDLARQYAETWMGFARELDERVQSMTGSAVSG
ncbi:ParB N-terminal domain-containing protein [Streptomyces sp. NPDC000410]|uniref:ParB/RepB/Spo0J family partition protein n=1 Tax=Streptomyces sp. NPDC000410 TaxID=3154254 RepID=UPI003320EE7C